MAAEAHPNKLKQIMDPALARAFTHPLRGHVLITLCERGTTSPKEIATELDIPVSEVSYHFRELAKRGLIRLVRTERRRGFHKHFYEPTGPLMYFDDFDWMRIPKPIRTSFSGEVLRRFVDEAIEALEEGSFDARDRHLSGTWLHVDEQGWHELMRVHEEALKRVLAIQRTCRSRQRNASRRGIPVCVAMAAFETAGGAGRHGDDAPEES